jgi:hypothetical protein
MFEELKDMFEGLFPDADKLNLEEMQRRVAPSAVVTAGTPKSEPQTTGTPDVTPPVPATASTVLPGCK